MINISKDTTLGELLAAGISFQLDFVANYKTLGEIADVVKDVETHVDKVEKVEVKPKKKPKKQEEPAPVIDIAPGSGPGHDDEHVSDDMLRAALRDLAADKGPQAVIDLTGPIKSLDDLDQARRAAIMEAING